MNATNGTSKSPSHEEIAAKAYDLWQHDGHKPGHDMTYWLQAEKDLITSCQIHLPAANPALSLNQAKPASKRNRISTRKTL